MYKKVESGGMTNINTIKQELSMLDDTNGDINPYKELIVNNAKKFEIVLSQMEQWSLLSNVINYIQYDKHPKNCHDLNIRTVNKEKHKRNSSKEEEEKCIRPRFWAHTRKIKRKIFRHVSRDTIRNTKHY